MTATRVPRAVLISGGWAHDFADSAQALAQELEPLGIETDVVVDLDEVGAALATADLLAVHACRWQMLHPRYDEHRAAHACRLAPATLAAFERWRAAGRPLLGLHTASICFDDWPGWLEWLGGGWDWARSWHPELRTLVVEPGDDHAIVRGLAPFEVVDERYTGLAMHDTTHVLARVEGEAVLWAGGGPGRVVYDALGHDRRSLQQTDHAVLLRRSAAWLLDWPDDQILEVR